MFQESSSLLRSSRALKSRSICRDICGSAAGAAAASAGGWSGVFPPKALLCGACSAHLSSAAWSAVWSLQS